MFQWIKLLLTKLDILLTLMPKLQESKKNGLRFSSGEFIVDMEDEEVMEGEGEPQPDDGSKKIKFILFLR